MRRLVTPLFAFVVATSAITQRARADEPHAVRPETKKRPIPDYDGRGMPEVEHDDAGVWLARVLLSPLYFVSEYLIRRPAALITKAVEHNEFSNDVYDFFVFGPRHKMGFLPVAFAEVGFLPSIGVYGFCDDCVVRGNHFRMHFEGWPTDSSSGAITDRYDVGKRSHVQVRALASSRPDDVFYGIGPSTLESARSRYTERRFDASAAFDSRVWRSSEVAGSLGVRKVEISDGHYSDDPSLSREADAGAFPIPFGFGRSYVAPYTDLRLRLDTRHPDARRGSSFRLEAESEQGEGFESTPASSWIRWGGSATGTFDLNDRGRLLSLTLAAEFADSLDHRPIPFTELVSLGGDHAMRGYFPGRLVDRSAMVATLEYAWPIAQKVDATLQASVGNVFGEHLDGMRPELLRFSGALGIATPLSDPPIEFLVGFGTETFEHGAQVDSVRVSIGVPRGF